MTYKHLIKGIFISRPNRFIAHVKVDDTEAVCHVKNTGRCRELLIPGVTVILEYHPSAAASGRKTEYDLIGVYKGGLLINMDSQAPNQAAHEWLIGLGLPGYRGQAVLSPLSGLAGEIRLPRDIRREVTHGDSRFDLAFSLSDEKTGLIKPAFMEVKGVTLEEGGLALFPDAPTERGVKHLRGLIKAHEEGYESYVLFVIQMKGIQGFSPNDRTHPAFGQALRDAFAAGIHVLAYDCIITPDAMTLDAPVPIRL